MTIRRKSGVMLTILIVLVSIVGMAALFTGSAAAEPVSEGGNEITNWTDLNQTRDNPSNNYVLVNNLDEDTDGYTNVVDPDGTGFIPIKDFSGEFDGQNNKIADLKLNENGDALGLFATTTGDVEIRNITMDVDGPVGGEDDAVGSLVGVNKGELTASSVDVNIEGGDNTDVGGVAGVNRGTITESDVTGGVKGGDEANVGGLVGRNDDGSVEHSSAASDTEAGDADHVGGLVGWNDRSIITDSHATGNVTTDDGVEVGGLVGHNLAGTISDSDATGDVEAGKPDGSQAKSGGLTGFNQGDIIQSYASGTVKIGDGAGEGVEFPNTAGGLVGQNWDTIEDSYATGGVEAGNLEEVGGLGG